MGLAAIIGGSGLTQLNNLEILRQEAVSTPYGEPSAPLVFGRLSGHDVVFLPRHGSSHTIAPHEINYRANIWALSDIGVEHVIAVAAVGAIADIPCPSLIIPDQIIDYTYGRRHTFYDAETKEVKHVDFSYPYCQELRATLIKAGQDINMAIRPHGTYGATQGPRFETAAEINRMEADGADIVGMTGMPEAGLARELELCYATIAVTVNPAAGKSDKEISLKQIEKNLYTGMQQVRLLVEKTIPLLK